MKRIFLISLLLPSQLGAGTMPPLTEDEINLRLWAAYEIGKRDASYKNDDIGLVRLTIKDIEGMI